VTSPFSTAPETESAEPTGVEAATGEVLTVLYNCPGEAHAISRSVHLARLAAFYPACRTCPSRDDTGQLAPKTVKRLQGTEGRVKRVTLFTNEGVRGKYLNELTRKEGGTIAGALASLLWEKSPRVGAVSSDRNQEFNLNISGHSVVVAYDERPTSLDMLMGVISALKRSGCRVINIGQTTTPCFWFAVDHLDAAAGIQVTGAGYDSSWTGFNIVSQNSVPLSMGTGLDQLESRYDSGFSRPSRQAGTLRDFQAAVPYEASLWKHFHALRPLKVCVGTSVKMARKLLQTLFESLPCELVDVPLNIRVRNLFDSDDSDARRVQDAIAKQRASLGFLIDDDGQKCSLFNERGEIIAAETMSTVLAEMLLKEHTQETVYLPKQILDSLPARLLHLEKSSLPSGETMAEMSAGMRKHRSVFGSDGAGRYWFRESFPACDAVLTLAKVLQRLSQSDAACSQVFPSSEH